MARSIFSSVWKESELAYSGVLAQTLGLSSAYRHLFLSKLAELTEPSIGSELRAAAESSVITIETEKYLGSLGRIDIFAEFGGAFTLGIENKKNAVLQENQLTRYDNYLRKKSVPFLLVFLAPSNYLLAIKEVEHLRRFVSLTYKVLNGWTNEYLIKGALSDLERHYFGEFNYFTGELEMKPLSNDEIGALIQHKVYRNAVNKLTDAMRILGPVEQSEKGFVLVGREIFVGYSVYRGIRYDTEWYFGAPLLNGGAEAIAYVKDQENDSKKAEDVNHYLELEAEKTGYIESLKAQLEYYARIEPNECRLVLRRPLVDFGDQDASHAIEWMSTATTRLEEILQAARSRGT
jgi:PD-(D/E)XK nuclease superfamily